MHRRPGAHSARRKHGAPSPPRSAGPPQEAASAATAARRATHRLMHRNVSRKSFRSAKVRCTVAVDMAISVQAHITGTIWKIELKAGDSAEEGQTLPIIEPMKMEMPVEAPSAGKVESAAA